jgi:hypothetical protein
MFAPLPGPPLTTPPVGRAQLCPAQAVLVPCDLPLLLGFCYAFSITWGSSWQAAPSGSGKIHPAVVKGAIMVGEKFSHASKRRNISSPSLMLDTWLVPLL